MIIGSASTQGRTSANQRLSDERIKSVKEILMSNGIIENQIDTEISLGESFMTEAEECRRVLVVIE